MTGIPLGQVTIFGSGFTQESVALIDGVPAVSTTLVNSQTVQVEIDVSLASTAGTHQFSVQTSGQTSNSLSFTVYSPQSGPQVMQAIPGFLVGENETNPTFIAAADVDGDGLADVVMPGPQLQTSGSIALLFGQADGTLSAAQYIACPNPYAVAVGDVNADGNTDLVSVSSDNSSSTTVSILLGDGHRDFQQPSTQQTFAGIFPRSAHLVDIDGDGKPDLVLEVESTAGITGSIVWLKNTGGGFAAPVTLAPFTALDNGDYIVADFNRDGKPDLLYTAAGSPESLHILFNQGNGQFSDQLVAGLNGIFGVPSMIDFNLDGIPDMVVQESQTVGGVSTVVLYSFQGNGNGSFMQVANTAIVPPGLIRYRLVAGDFDHDGFPDLAGVNGASEPSSILYLFGDGRGHFTPQQVVGPEGTLVATGDFNGDGLPDVAVPDNFNFVSIALGRTDRNFPSTLSLTPAIAGFLSSDDINGDGLPEIFVAGGDSPGIPGTVFLNQGNSSFQFGGNTDQSSLMLADLTGRSVADLLGVSTNFVVWPNNGSLDFSSTPIPLPPANGPFTVADMDGDGHPDIVALGEVLYGNGAYQFTPVVTTDSFAAPYVIGDFNGDGRPDIATGTFTYLNSGERIFQEVRNDLPLGNGALAVAADFNGDGKDDIAIVLPGDTAISIWYSRGDGTFYEGTEIDPGQFVGALAVGDFNGDGKPDIAAGLILSQQVTLLFNNGQGQFTRSFFASGAFTIGMIQSDLNRNGKPDLVIGNFQVSGSPANVDVVFHK